MLTRPIIQKTISLTDEEYQEKVKLFEELLPKVSGYIRHQAQLKAAKSPDKALDVEDFEEVGLIQAWAAVVSWDPSKGSLETWAKRRIWTNMNVVVSSRFVKKRLFRMDDGTTASPVSIQEGDDVTLLNTLSGPDREEPFTQVCERDLSQKLRRQLLDTGDRVAAAVLRLITRPDKELTCLCSKGRLTKISNKVLAARLGVSTVRISAAKARIKEVVKCLQ